MLTKLFVSGKNWKLSLAEIAAYLKAREINLKVREFSREFFVIDVPDTGTVAIDDLGGIIKIGKTQTSFRTQTAKQAFLEKDKAAKQELKTNLSESSIVPEMKDDSGKVFFGVSVYCSDNTLRPLSAGIQRFFGSAIKDELSTGGRKGKFMGFSKGKLPQLSHIEVLKKNLVETHAETLLFIGRQESWLGTTEAVHNPFEFQKRDVYKPNQRRIFAMPPRLARIMVNLSACTPGKVLLDPFCGVGTILQEALLAKAKVVGVDANLWCVKATNENLDWLSQEYNLADADFRVVQGEIAKLAQKVGRESVDCIVTEPDLGPALRQVPTGPYAERIIQKLEPLFFDFADQAAQVLREGGKITLVTPYIVTRSGKGVTMPISDKLDSLGLKRTRPFEKELFATQSEGTESLTALSSLIEVDERHKIGRQIHVYQK